MDDYELAFTRSAAKELGDLPPEVRARVAAAIERLPHEPRPQGVQKLRIGSDLYRIRVGDYRVVYQLSDVERSITVTRVRHRSEAYGS